MTCGVEMPWGPNMTIRSGEAKLVVESEAPRHPTAMR